MKEIILDLALVISLVIGALVGFKIFKWLRNNFVFIGTPVGFISAFVACAMFPAMLVYGTLEGITNGVDNTVSNITKPKYEKYIDDAKQAETIEEKIKYLKKSLKKEYNTQALKDIRDILVMEIQIGKEYEEYYNMIKGSLKKKDLETMDIEIYKALASNELYYKNYDEAMNYLKKAEALGMNIGDSHVYWEIKDIKDYERTHNNEENKINSDEEIKDKKNEYLDKLNSIKDELSELNYGDTTLEMKEASVIALNKWDDALNEIYNEVKNHLSSEDMEMVKIEQKDWVIRRDKRAEEDSIMSKGGSMEEIEYTESLSNSTKERCYELVEKYLN